MEKRFEIIEKEFQAMMATFGVKGDCKIDYEENHIVPAGGTFSGRVTCTINVYDDVYHRHYNECAEYDPVEQTANEFVSNFKAFLFDVLADTTKKY